MRLNRKFSGKWALQSARFTDRRATAAHFWSERNRRERILIALGVAVVLLGLLYVLLIDPALQGRAQLRKNLPVLRQQSAQLQAMAKQAAALPKVAAPTATSVSKESIEAALQTSGLRAKSVAWSGDFAQLQFTEVPFNALLDALQPLQKTMRLAVVEATVTATGTAGSVNASLTLRAQKAD
ncbi:MAG: type II secretion system protein M [Glaciimonas sp.]|nr:type II secretion system protein M [Glaciimonas sp.]